MHELTGDPRTYFAAERTFLAWIRTGVALIGVGFAVARFGLFLQELRPTEIYTEVQRTGLSVYSGVALVAIGVLVNLGAIANHFKTVNELKSGSWLPGRVSRSAVVLATMLALGGIAMGIYLLRLG